MTPTLLTISTFLAASLLILGLYSITFDLVLKDRARVSQRLDEEFRQDQRKRIQRSPVFKNLAKPVAEGGGDSPDGATVMERFQTLLEQAGMGITPRRLLGIMVVLGVGAGAVTGLLGRTWVAGVVVGLVGTAAPLFYVRLKRQRRLDKLLSQLPDAFELTGRLIRAGQTINQAFQGVADEFQPPIASEFAYCYEQQNLGLSPELAYRDLGRRIGLVEMKIFVLAVLVQRQTGGNLAELIDNLATIVRERFRIRGKIRVMTAEGRMEASVLLALPPVTFGMIYFLNRAYAMMLFDHPNLLWGMGGLMLLGVLWIRKIINFDF